MKKIRIAIVAALLGLLPNGAAKAQQNVASQKQDTLIFTTMDQLEANVRAVAEAVRRNRNNAPGAALTAEDIRLLKYQMLLNALGLNLGGAQHQHGPACQHGKKADGDLEARLDRLEAMIAQLAGKNPQVVVQPNSDEALRQKLQGLESQLSALNAGADTITLSSTVSYFKRQVFFPVSKYSLTKTAQRTLNEVVRIMKEDPEMHLFLTGYASPEGPKDFNLRLSGQRAERVLGYLIEHGISRDRFHIVNGGIDNQDDLRATARRVDLNLRK